MVSYRLLSTASVVCNLQMRLGADSVAGLPGLVLTAADAGRTELDVIFSLLSEQLHRSLSVNPLALWFLLVGLLSVL